MGLFSFLVGVGVGGGAAIYGIKNGYISTDSTSTIIGKNLNVNVNGKNFNGDKFEISKDKLKVDSKEQTGGHGNFSINVKGDVESINTIGPVSVTGNVKDIKTVGMVNVGGKCDKINTVGRVTVANSEKQ